MKLYETFYLYEVYLTNKNNSKWLFSQFLIRFQSLCSLTEITRKNSPVNKKCHSPSST